MQNANPIDKLYPHATSAMDNSLAKHLKMAVATLGQTCHLYGSAAEHLEVAGSILVQPHLLRGSAMWLQLQHHIVCGHRPMTENRARLQRDQPGGVTHSRHASLLRACTLAGMQLGEPFCSKQPPYD